MSDQVPAARVRARALLRAPQESRVATAGYLDALPAQAPRHPGLAQRTMRWSLLPEIYERLWRPVAFTALTARTTGAEERLMLRRLGPMPGDRMLDVACGPGNTTRRLAARAGEQGLVVGLDAAPTMLARAIADTSSPSVAYVRGDALDLPFKDAQFDVVSCFGVLYMLADPASAIAELARMLAPGGRLCVLTASTLLGGPAGSVSHQLGRLSGFNLQHPRFVAEQLEAAGLEQITVDTRGFGQVAAGRRAA